MPNIMSPYPCQTHMKWLAMKIALHQFGKYIRDTRKYFNKDELQLNSAYFLYSMPHSARCVEFPPEYWNEIVQNRDILQLSFRSTSESNEQDKTVKFSQLLHARSGGVRVEDVVTFPWPGSYDAARLASKSFFYEDKQVSEIYLYIKTDPMGSSNPWKKVDPNTSDKDWIALTNDKEVEIGVWGF
ncbi:hypothetical protein CPB84DRAFT_1784939 [Gymnopilus junonius]|uniref:Uncharacterized protein n=1 Tax=Gymnopilus junonius TaxID=109634 RepID=A0A9P5NIK6_GYMJU|nr:hypothetical protein CPB84DRAFT_1784939 [Gymnopilus junonius]